eukprot:244299-Amorphochlora_amoeboformis.AAC.1
MLPYHCANATVALCQHDTMPVTQCEHAMPPSHHERSRHLGPILRLICGFGVSMCVGSQSGLGVGLGVGLANMVTSLSAEAQTTIQPTTD